VELRWCSTERGEHIVPSDPLTSDFDTVIQNTVHHQLVTARQKALGTTDVP
jgi:hypothetical protein